MDREAWRAAIHGVEKSRTRLSDELSQFWGFPGSSAGKESTCNSGDLGSIPGLGRSPGEGKGYTLQYSGLENSIDHMVHGIARSGTRPSDFHWAPRAGEEASES